MDRLETLATTRKLYVCIEGNIGAGKSSLAEALGAPGACPALGESVIVQQEPAEGRNPYLADYYRDPKRYALGMQVYLLSQRRRMQMAAQALCLSGHASVIADRSYFGDRCFAEVQRDLGYFSEADFATYLSLHKDMQAELLYPSAFIWLASPVSLCQERIARRRSEIEGRECESGIDADYLTRLDGAIARMMHAMERYTPVLRLSPLAADGEEKPMAELCREVSGWLAKREPAYDSWQGVG